MSQGSTRFINRYTDMIIKFRFLVIIATVAAILVLAQGATRLEMQQNYRMFFGPNNPQLAAFDELEAVFTKNDNHIFVVHNPEGTIFNERTLTAIRELTTEGWQIPLSNRVDSISNYQHSWAIEDDMLVEDLIPEGMEGDPDTLARAEMVSQTEPAIMGFQINRDMDTATVVVRIQLDPDDVEAVGATAKHSRALIATMNAKYPELTFALSGTGLMSASFGEAPERDGETVFPAMFILLIVFMFIFTRSVTGTIATLGVIALSTMGAMGASGFYGYGINPANVAAPVVILTLAIADSVHILLAMFKEMRKGTGKLESIHEAMRINAQPVFLTSLTTAIGFLVMNFSDAPPFQELGNITATGVGLAYILSMTFLPATLAVLPVHVPKGQERTLGMMVWLAEFNIRHRKKLVFVIGGSIVFFVSSISRMVIDDVPHQYFTKNIAFRTDTDFFDEKIGFYGFFMSIEAAEPGGINDPEYLKSLDSYVEWLRAQPGVAFVGSYVDIAKKLNMNMHGDDPAYRVVPQDRELAAQYLLLYEMSLPFGLDLNDQINVDKSATRLWVNFWNSTLAEVTKVGEDGQAWINENGTNIHAGPPTGPPVMFAYITEANIYSMIRGTVLGFGLIAIILIVSLRSPVVGLLSLIPNILPAATAFGIWAVFVGTAGFAISIVAGLSIGIIVDDTVHFLSKYSRARRELHLNSEDAVRYAFTTVGQALLSTSFIVAGGFAVLMLSSFRVTAFMGALTSLTVVCALLADFLMLPGLLLLLDRRLMADAPVSKETS